MKQLLVLFLIVLILLMHYLTPSIIPAQLLKITL
jgi:hypothetical protein